jgi:hypothetical protein
MAYVMGQATVPTGTCATLFSTPAGLCNVTFWNVSAGTVYTGTSTSLTTSNGLQCHSIPTNFFTYVGSKNATFYGTCPTAGGATVNYIITTDF